jgi:hypothetical protein
MRILTTVTTAAIALAVAFSPLAAQSAPAAPTAGWRAEFLRSYAQIESKYVQLAQATPWDKYSWHPAGDVTVRSPCEVLMHITGENYAFAEPLGVKTPSSIDQKTIERCPASKEQTIAAVKQSFAFTRDAVLKTSDGDADAVVKLFGSSATKRGVLLAMAEHSGEHLGQLIAYARMNGIVPPWSAKGGM